MNKYNSNGLEDFLADLLSKNGAQNVVDCLSFLTGAFVITTDGRIIAANDAFLELLGYERSELYGMNAVELVAADYQEDLERRLLHDMTNRYHLKLVTKSAEKRYVVVSPRILFSGGIKYRLAEFVDYTDYVLLQQGQLTSFQNTASALTHTIEHRDPYTQGHMARTAQIAIKIATFLELEKDTVDLIVLGASLHDIGKISVPIEILTKPKRLESHEWAFVQKHPEIGHEILCDIQFNEAVTDIVLHHHERQDGSGYPDGLQGTEIPIATAIVAVADSLDAIAGVRPYRKAYSFPEAIQILEEEKQKHHRDALAAAKHLVSAHELDGKEFSPSLSY